jgi:hypothetical protein
MPITQAVHGGGTSPTQRRRVYYTGTDTLKEGYALCYNFDATDVTAENLTLSQADSLVETPARRLQVEKPTINNSTHFAGVVSQKFTDFTGPGWIEINMPGSVCNIWAGANCDCPEVSVTSGQEQIVTMKQLLVSRVVRRWHSPLVPTRLTTVDCPGLGQLLCSKMSTEVPQLGSC